MSAADRPHTIHVSDIEQALNYLRGKHPSEDGFSLAEPVRSLADVYGMMAYLQQDLTDAQAMSDAAYAAWMQWYETTPDTPCIAICSTSQGDAVCKGCGRSFDEVQHWQAMSPAQKRTVWRRIDTEQLAWRYNRYRERVTGNMAQAGLFTQADTEPEEQTGQEERK